MAHDLDQDRLLRELQDSVDALRQDSTKLWRKVLWRYVDHVGWIILFFWCLYFAKVWFGFDLFELLGDRDRPPSSSLFEWWVAVTSTLLGATYVGWQSRRAVQLIRCGVVAVGQVARVGAVRVKGWKRVDCKYTYEGKDYTTAWSQQKFSDAKYKPGEGVILIIDPKNPRRFVRKEEVFGPDLEARASLGEFIPERDLMSSQLDDAANLDI